MATTNRTEIKPRNMKRKPDLRKTTQKLITTKEKSHPLPATEQKPVRKRGKPKPFKPKIDPRTTASENLYKLANSMGIPTRDHLNRMYTACYKAAKGCVVDLDGWRYFNCPGTEDEEESEVDEVVFIDDDGITPLFDPLNLHTRVVRTRITGKGKVLSPQGEPLITYTDWYASWQATERSSENRVSAFKECIEIGSTKTLISILPLPTDKVTHSLILQRLRQYTFSECGKQLQGIRLTKTELVTITAEASQELMKAYLEHVTSLNKKGLEESIQLLEAQQARKDLDWPNAIAHAVQNKNLRAVRVLWNSVMTQSPVYASLFLGIVSASTLGGAYFCLKKAKNCLFRTKPDFITEGLKNGSIVELPNAVRAFSVREDVSEAYGILKTLTPLIKKIFSGIATNTAEVVGENVGTVVEVGSGMVSTAQDVGIDQLWKFHERSNDALRAVTKISTKTATHSLAAMEEVVDTSKVVVSALPGQLRSWTSRVTSVAACGGGVLYGGVKHALYHTTTATKSATSYLAKVISSVSSSLWSKPTVRKAGVVFIYNGKRYMRYATEEAKGTSPIRKIVYLVGATAILTGAFYIYGLFRRRDGSRRR